TTNAPPWRRAKSQLNRAVRALPTWKKPVGEGAIRTRGASTRSVLFDRDRARGTTVDRLDELRAEGLVGVVVEHVQEPVVAHLEDLRKDPHADGIARTLVVVNDN